MHIRFMHGLFYIRKGYEDMKVFYEVDPHNRLVVKRAKGKSSVKKFRQVVSGSFKTDRKNRLFYEIFKPSGTDIPRKLKFSGRYSLDRECNLIFTLNKSKAQNAGDRLRLRTAIVEANGGELVFLLNSGISKNNKVSRMLKLRGAWQADKNNRLTFGVEKEKGKKDTLVLFNAWNINKNNEITYRYGRRAEAVKLKGSWRLKDKYRMSYIIDRRINSGFDFRVQAAQIVPEKRKTYMAFGVRIDISRKKRVTRKIIFTCRLKSGKGNRVLLEFVPRKGSAGLKFKKQILHRKGFAYIESFLKDKERYFGGGLAFRW